MDILRLQPHLKEAFESLADALRHFDFEVVMMGGSVLAAKWHHRWSTDIDLFVPEDSLFVEGTSEADLQRRVVGRLLDSGVIGRDAARSAESNEFGVDAHTVHGTPFSIHPSPYLLASPPDGPWVEGTEIRAATDQETWDGKLLGRTGKALARERAGKPLVPIRDVYDFAVMANLHPDEATAILRNMRTSNRRVAYNVYRYLPDDLHEIDPDELVHEQYVFGDLGSLPQAVALALRDGVISHIPECTRRVDPKPSLGSVEGGPEPDDPIGTSGCGMR